MKQMQQRHRIRTTGDTDQIPPPLRCVFKPLWNPHQHDKSLPIPPPNGQPETRHPARERFVAWIDKTSAAGGIPLPLGASGAVIEAGRQVIDRHGPVALAKVAKLHFRTSARILGHPGPDGTQTA